MSPMKAAASSATIGIPRRFIPWAIVNEIHPVKGRWLEKHRQIPSCRAGRNLLAFLDAFKAIGGLKVASSPILKALVERI